MFEKLIKKIEEDYNYQSDVNKHLNNYVWSCRTITGNVTSIIKNVKFFDLDPDLIKETEEVLLKLVNAIPLKRTDAYNYIEKSIANDKEPDLRKIEW